MRPQLLLISLILSACGGASPAPKPAPVAVVVVPKAEPAEEAEEAEPEPEPPAPPKPERARVVEVVRAESELDDILAVGPSLRGGSTLAGGLVGGGIAGGGKLGAGGGGLGGGRVSTRIGGPSGPASSGSASRATVKLGAVTVQGQLPSNAVRRVLRARLARTRYCFQRQLRTTPALSGTMTVAFVITASGSVTSVQVSALDSALDACVKRVISRVRFPQPKAGIVDVSYPLTFIKSF